MTHLAQAGGLKLTAALLGLAVLSGCASVSLEKNLDRVNQEIIGFSGEKLQLARNAF